MTGIVTYGGYVPFHRIKKSEIAAAYGKIAKTGEKAVAYYDEDSLTMAVAASLNAIPSADGKDLKGVYFATTTSPYREKQCASQIAAVMDCNHAVRSADFSSSLKCASDAMLTALEFAKSGERTLVAAADCRLGGNDGSYENDLGDGGAAFVFGDGDDVIAEFIGSATVSIEGYDMWRLQDSKIVRFWDVRFANTQLYVPMVTEAVKNVLAQTSLKPEDFAAVVSYAHEERYIASPLLKLGFTADQIKPTLYGEIGNTGCAAAPLMLANALDDAKPGDKILSLFYGDGCNALVFEATEKIAGYKPAHKVREIIDRKNNTLTYGKYLKWKEFLECEPMRRPDQERSSQPDYFRGYKRNNAMWGSKCKVCGKPHYPPQRVCATCHSVDQMEPYRFIGKKAWLRTFTLDGVSLSLDPPNNLVVVEFEGGGKMMTFLDDCDKNDIHVKMPVELSFRRMFRAGQVNTYFWKVVPDTKKEDA